MKIEGLCPPPPGQRVQGWCLYRSDRWEWECPQQEDEPVFVPVPVPDPDGAGLHGSGQTRSDGRPKRVRSARQAGEGEILRIARFGIGSAPDFPEAAKVDFRSGDVDGFDAATYVSP
jgi:hypothetical protein